MSSNLFEKLILFWFSLLAFAVFYFILRSDSLLWDFILSEIFGTKLTPYSITNIDSWKPCLSWKNLANCWSFLSTSFILKKKNLENQIHYREIVITNVFFQHELFLHLISFSTRNLDYENWFIMFIRRSQMQNDSWCIKK